MNWSVAAHDSWVSLRMGILIQTSLIYIFSLTLSLGVSTRIGNEIGAYRLEKDRNPMVVSLV
jgi:MATE family multidrug resistance protein